MQTLTVLNLQRNEIGDQGAQYLANALQTNTVTQLLYSFITYSQSSLNTDTHNLKSSNEQNRR